MLKSQIKLALLAITIASVSRPALSASGEDLALDYGAGVLALNKATYNNIDLVGVLSEANSTGYQKRALDLWNVQLEGNLTNHSDLNLVGKYVDGLFVSSRQCAGVSGCVYTPTNIGGNYINDGNITIAGLGGTAMYFWDSSLKGDFVNNGNLFPGDQGTALWVLNSSIEGNLINHGDIYSSGNRALGIVVQSTSLWGELQNYGNIVVEGKGAKALQAWGIKGQGHNGSIRNEGLYRTIGDNSIAMDVSGGTFNGLINSGTIDASGDNAIALSMVESNNIAVSNTGTISAKGEGAVAVQMEGVSLADGIYNTGQITADDVAINVITGGSPFVIHQNGGSILGGGAAIKGGSTTSLEWTNGEIHGDILDMNDVSIDGNASFSVAKFRQVLLMLSQVYSSLTLSIRIFSVTSLWRQIRCYKCTFRQTQIQIQQFSMCLAGLHSRTTHKSN